MADTHINAYEADVEAAKLKVVQANGELQAAQIALESHPDYVAPKKEKLTKEADEVSDKSSTKNKKVVQDASDGKFVSKNKASESPKTTVTETVTLK